MVAHHYDANVILFKVITNRKAATLDTAWTTINNRLIKTGVISKSYIMDHECSEELKTALHKAESTFQLLPPHTHRANKAERII